MKEMVKLTDRTCDRRKIEPTTFERWGRKLYTLIPGEG